MLTLLFLRGVHHENSKVQTAVQQYVIKAWILENQLWKCESQDAVMFAWAAAMVKYPAGVTGKWKFSVLSPGISATNAILG